MNQKLVELNPAFADLSAEKQQEIEQLLSEGNAYLLVMNNHELAAYFEEERKRNEEVKALELKPRLKKAEIRPRMKSRLETSMKWDFVKFDDKLGRAAGVKTNLPPSIRHKKKEAPRIEEVSVYSLDGEKLAYIRIKYDQYSGSGYWGIDPLRVKLSAFHTNWYERGIVSGQGGGGEKFLEVEFNHSIKDGPLCEAATWRVIEILKDLGVEAGQIPYPTVTYRPYVWVKKDENFKSESGFPNWGWTELGEWLGFKSKQKKGGGHEFV